MTRIADSLISFSFFVGTAKGDDACFDEPLIVRCEALQTVNRVVDVEWKAQNFKSDPWMRFGYCSGSMACVVRKPLLPNGIKAVNIFNGTLTIQRSAKNSTNRQAQLKCEVHYSDHSVKHHVLKMNFTACKFHSTAFKFHSYDV